MPERFAIYYAPAASDPLWTKATQWLGHDPIGDTPVDGPLSGVTRDALFDRSVSARRYGFHATIKAPMALRQELRPEALDAALAAFAAERAPVSTGPLKLALLDGFLALVPQVQSEALTALAGDVVSAFDSYRQPMSPGERERRLKGGHLSARQVELLEQFGYPYVLEQFQFHMTLTDRLPVGDREAYQRAAASHFGTLAERDAVIDRLVLYHEAESGAPFRRLGDYMLNGKIAG